MKRDAAADGIAADGGDGNVASMNAEPDTLPDGEGALPTSVVSQAAEAEHDRTPEE